MTARLCAFLQKLHRMSRYCLTPAVLLCMNVGGTAYAQTQSLFTTQTPAIPSATDGVAYELGMKLQVARSGQITGIRYWKATGDSALHVGKIWSSTGTLLSSVTFSGETASGWQQQSLTSPITVQANTTYVVSVNVASNFPVTTGGLSSPIVNGDVRSLADGNNGVFGNTAVLPTSSYQNSNYFRDIVFVADTVGAPSKLTLAPSTANSQTGVAVGYAATIQDANGNTVSTASNPISFTVSGISGTFNPASPVAPSGGVATTNLTPTTSGVATVSASAAGLTGASATLAVSASTGTPQTLFTTQAPVLSSVSDGVPYELGMKFQVSRAGTISALRYWKASGESGVHVGRIWSATGTLLASTTFSTETASGWQQQTLSSALAVQANTTYVVSVNTNGNFAVTTAGLQSQIVNGRISSVADGSNGVFGNPFAFPTQSYQSSNYFRDVVYTPDASGPATKIGITPMQASAQTGFTVTYTAAVQDVDGNTVPGATNPITFSVSGVTGAFNPSTSEGPITPTNGVAVSAFTPSSTGTATVIASSQGLGSAAATLVVTSGAGTPSRVQITPSSANTTNGTPLAFKAFVEDASGNVLLSATNPITFSVAGVSGSFAPSAPVTPTNGTANSAFTPTTTGVATVTASAAGLTSDQSTVLVVSGSAQMLFTNQIPALQNAADGVAYELGMKFQVARPGTISAIRYWKSPSDGGTHVGRIWSSAGALLASTTFTNESSSGWQQQTLSTPLRLLANTTYVVSVNIATNYPFTANALTTSIVNGDVSSVADGNNGVYGNPGAFPTQSYQSSNYFRDIVFFADPVSTISVVSGDKQHGASAAVLPNPFTVLVRDGNNNPLSNASVTFAITSGAGSLSNTTVLTNVNGTASTVLTLAASGRTTVSATYATAGSVAFQAYVDNAISLENQQAGTTAWRITNLVTAAAPEIAGYAGAVSVNKGGTLPLKITLATPGQYRIDVYRLGYYANTGGRLMGSFGPFTGVTQPPCNVTDAATRLIECNWNTSFTLAVGSGWTSGLYIANLTAVSSGKQSQIWFVVRDDSSHSDILYQSTFTTYIAYNNYGDAERHSLYEQNSSNGQRAFKVSLDRPFGAVTVDQVQYNYMTLYERNMVRWLESQNYDVSYVTNLDVHTNASSLLQHKLFLIAGHDEYWSLEMRNGIEQARDQGINMAFLTANAGYWRVRFEPSSTGDPNRVMVCYKDPAANDPIAPTYLWRGPENNRPENALFGVYYVADYSAQQQGFDLIVSNANDPYYNNTHVLNGMALDKLVGYEWDAVVNNGFTPNGLVVLGQSPTDPAEVAPTLPPGANTAISNAVRYTAASGAQVFSSGSIQFVWGLDSDNVSPAREDTRVKQFVINVLGNMGAKPLTPDAGMIVP